MTPIKDVYDWCNNCSVDQENYDDESYAHCLACLRLTLKVKYIKISRPVNFNKKV